MRRIEEKSRQPFGFKLDEGWGKAAFWFWVVGFYLAFMPLYVMGLEGMPRRMQRIIVGYGFWIFLLSDFVMFSAFFATYAVLKDRTAGGPGAHQLFDMTDIALETGALLLSSFTCGLMSLEMDRKRLWPTEAWMLVTGLLGFLFVFLEGKEFAHLVAMGDGPQRSGFLTAFFTLVGCHGMHVSIGLLWLGTMMAQVYFKGFRQDIQFRVLCFSLFWHALDIIWVAIFTLVYLIGVHG